MFPHRLKWYFINYTLQIIKLLLKANEQVFLYFSNFEDMSHQRMFYAYRIYENKIPRTKGFRKKEFNFEKYKNTCVKVN